MQQMSEYVTSFRDTENVYYLSKDGRERVDSQVVRKKTLQARHYVMRNDVYIAEGRPLSWRTEVKIEVPGKVRIIADALFDRAKRLHIVEVDHTQKMSKNRIKIERYRQLLSLEMTEQPPLFIWVTTTEYRRKQLTKLMSDMQHKIYTVEDLR
ncbi:hypothetical protein [Bacillus sp. JCM 19041]|uniref:hypothetical protein n=1 Tax=Bacillus sp. JCM 19041 TaxID=1460637 RepID=UPI0006D1D74E